MKSRFHLLMFCLLAAASTVSPATLEFRGYMSVSGDSRFVIADTDTGQQSTWLSVGQSFQKHRIVGFDGKNETIILLLDSHTIRLPLRASKVVDSRAIAGANTIGVTIGAQHTIFIRDDPAARELLRSELRRAATFSPQPTITLQASATAEASLLTSLFDLLKDCGLKKIAISTNPRE